MGGRGGQKKIYQYCTDSSGAWRMAAALTELRHDAVLDFQGHRRELRWTHRLVSRTNSTVHGVFHGHFDVELTSQTEALVCRCSSRLVGTDKDICDR